MDLLKGKHIYYFILQRYRLHVVLNNNDVRLHVAC
jgi:hypothetical protein